MRTTFLTTGILLLSSGLSAWCGDWNPRLAADYLDAREKAWFAWPVAKTAGGTCVSCHTGMAYLLARPALRKLLGEAQPTEYETGLLDGMKQRTLKGERMFGGATWAHEPGASQAGDVQTILAALLLARDDRSSIMSQATEQAFDSLWASQRREGPTKGAWSWFELNLDPYETIDSAYYGATLAAVAAGSAPASYREKPDVKTHIVDLVAYLRSAQEGQPLHNRLMLLWVAAALPGALPKDACQQLVAEALGKQQPDGGWTLESLGPWKEHPTALPSSGSNAYATAVVAVALERAGLTRSNPGLAKALDWLRSHQNPAGYWDAISMNKRYDAGSMQELFMRDAATSFAALALTTADAHARVE